MRSSKRLLFTSTKKSKSVSKGSNVLSSKMSINKSDRQQCPMEVENTSAQVNIEGTGTSVPADGTNGDETLVNVKIPALDKYNLRVKSIQKRIEVEKKRKNPRKEPKPKQRPPPLSKYRRKNANARERSRMQEMNQAFMNLKKAVPQLASDSDVGEDQNSKLTKITTLRRAVKYIAALTMLLSETGPLMDEENTNSIETNGAMVSSMKQSTDQSFLCSNISSPSPSVSSISSISSASISSSSSASSSYSLSISSPSSSSSSIQSPSSCSSLTLDLQSVNLNNQLGDNLIIHPSQLFNSSSNQINYDCDNNYLPLESTPVGNQHSIQFDVAQTASSANNQHSSPPPPPTTTTISTGASTINLTSQQLYNSSLTQNQLQQVNPNQQQPQQQQPSSTNQDSNLNIYMDFDLNDLPVESSLPLLDADCYSYLPDSFDDFKLIAADMIPESDFESFKIDSEILSNSLITSW